MNVNRVGVSRGVEELPDLRGARQGLLGDRLIPVQRAGGRGTQHRLDSPIPVPSLEQQDAPAGGGGGQCGQGPGHRPQVRGQLGPRPVGKRQRHPELHDLAAAARVNRIPVRER